MAYAGAQHVRSAAGKVSNYWTDTARPNDTDIDGWLDDASSQIDLVLSAAGASVPLVDGTVAAESLRPLVVAYALVQALNASFAGSPPSDEVTALRDAAQARWDAWFASVQAGTNPIITIVTQGLDVGGVAGSLWGDEVLYGQVGAASFPEDDNFRLAPYIARGDPM